MRNNRVLCDCELNGMCVEHLFCEEQRLLQLYQRSLRSNKSKMLTLSYLCGLSKVYYDLDNYKACIDYGMRAEESFNRLKINNEQRVNTFINVCESCYRLKQFGLLEKLLSVSLNIVPASDTGHWLFLLHMRTEIFIEKGDAQSYLDSLRREREYCNDIAGNVSIEAELFLFEVKTLYNLRCFIGAYELLEDYIDFSAVHDISAEQHCYGELEELVGRALIDRHDIEEHPWNTMSVCYNCWKVGTKQGRCSGCNSVHFCSYECQAAKWPTHKYQCSLRSQ